jgi:hypothetical protein
MNKPIIDNNGKFIYNENYNLEKEYDILFDKFLFIVYFYVSYQFKFFF